MLTVKDINPDPHLSVYIAVAFAKEVLPIFEEEYPENLGPRKAIEVAEAYLRGEEVYAASAYDAASAASGSAYAGSAGYASSSAASAASAASYAVSAASAASASYTASAASYAVSAASAYTAASNREEYIHERLLKMLPYILQYKIDNQQSFGNPEKVLEYLNEEQQTVALFHLDSLV